MRRKYMDCQRADGNCAVCSMVSYGRDCHGRNITKLEWNRLLVGLERKELAEISKVNVRQIQRIEMEEGKMGNMTLTNAIALADALGVDVRELL